MQAESAGGRVHVLEGGDKREGPRGEVGRLGSSAERKRKDDNFLQLPVCWIKRA